MAARSKLIERVNHLAMSCLESELDSLAAETAFSGVVRVDRTDRVEMSKAYGFAHRGFEIPNDVGMRFATASGTKSLTALSVVSLIEDGLLELSTPARSVLGSDLPLIDDGVTVEQLLAHRSGIGDYLDEDAGELDPSDYVMAVPVHELVRTEDYLEVLDGHPTKFAPGERFAYCNSGYVVLALIIERASGLPFHDLVRERVCEPAGMRQTEFLRSDAPVDAAVGYLEVDGSWRSNVLHLPVRGSGDGGIYTTVADMSSFWESFWSGGIVSPDWVREMVGPRSVASDSRRYGLGFWLHATTDAVMLEGCDAGVSFRSVHDPSAQVTYTVISNTTDGAWAICRFLEDRLGWTRLRLT